MRGTGFIVVGLCGALITGEARSQEKAAEKEVAEKKDVASATKVFEDAYNAHDVAKLITLFTSDAVLIDEDGNKSEGQKSLQKLFEQTFVDLPDAQIHVDIETIRPVTSTLAIEDGWTTFAAEPGAPEAKRRYSIVNVKKDGKWLISSVKDYAPEKAVSPHEHLQKLAWLIGEWIDEQDESLVETSCRWSEDGNFLLQDFTVRIAGSVSMKGTQRIGWDPLRKSFRSWIFDSEGGYSEATWWRDGYSWLIKAEGVTPDGDTASACRTIIPQGKMPT